MKDDESFIRDLGRSHQAVNDFAERSRRNGWQLWLPPEVLRPDASLRRLYADDGDLMLQVRIEHKVRTNITWTCRADYPFQTVIVDEVYKVDKKSDMPVFMYVIEDQTAQYAAIVYGLTRRHWKTERMRDRIQNRDCDFYTIDKDKVRFCVIDEVFGTRRRLVDGPEGNECK